MICSAKRQMEIDEAARDTPVAAYDAKLVGKNSYADQKDMLTRYLWRKQKVRKLCDTALLPMLTE